MKKYCLPVLYIVLAAFLGGCSKDLGLGSGSLYSPTTANVTANATLQELQQGRTLYMQNCNACHSLYSPESYTPMQWKSILSNMAPRTGMTASEIQLVTKYVCMGK